MCSQFVHVTNDIGCRTQRMQVYQIEDLFYSELSDQYILINNALL